MEKYKHTLYHVMHSETGMSCPFIHDQSEEKVQYINYVHQRIYVAMCIVKYTM